MPLDPDSSSPPPAPPHRDWFFPPAPPFLPSSRARTPRTPFPSTYRSSNPYSAYSLADRRPPPTPRSRSRSPHPPPEQQQQLTPPPSTPPSAPRRRDPRYAGVRREDVRTAASEQAAPPTSAPVHGRKLAASAIAPRWSGVLSAAVRNGWTRWGFTCLTFVDSGCLIVESVRLRLFYCAWPPFSAGTSRCTIRFTICRYGTTLSYLVLREFVKHLYIPLIDLITLFHCDCFRSSWL